MTHSYHLMKTALLILGLTVGLAACSDETVGTGSGGGSSSSSGSGSGSGSGSSTGSAMATEGSLAGKVSYTGTAKGQLVMTTFSMVKPGPPGGPPTLPVPPPTGLDVVEDAMWPGEVSYEIKKLKPGDHYVFGYISVGNFHMEPQMGDPVAVYGDMMGKAMPITIKAGEVTMAPLIKAIDLGPPPGDGGTGDGGP
jgi:hypothetical protein